MISTHFTTTNPSRTSHQKIPRIYYFSHTLTVVLVWLSTRNTWKKRVLKLWSSTQRSFLHKILPKNSNDKAIKIVAADIESFRRLDEIKRRSGNNEKSIPVHVHKPLLIAQYDGNGLSNSEEKTLSTSTANILSKSIEIGWSGGIMVESMAPISC